MFADQVSLDFTKNQASLLLDRIHNKLNNKFSKASVRGNLITLFIRKQDISRLHGLIIPERIGSLKVKAELLKEGKRKNLHI